MAGCNVPGGHVSGFTLVTCIAMTLLQSIKRSRHWLPFARVYQRSGLKARVYASALTPPVKTVPEAELFRQLDLTATAGEGSLPDFNPPVPVAAGPMPAEDAAFFARLVRALAPRQVFEFGTNWGVATTILARNTPADARIRTLDVCREMFSAEHLAADPELQMILPREHTGWRYRQEPEAGLKVKQVFDDSMTYLMPPEPKCDLILVDACHQFDFIAKDTANALRGIRPGGVVIWHDFYPDVSSWPDVFRYLSAFAHEHPGVVHVQGTHFAVWQAR